MAQEQQAETERTPTEPAPSVGHSNSPCPRRSSPGFWRHLGRQERRRHCGTTRVVGFADAELTFHPLPFLSNDDVADVLQIARARIVALLRRKGGLPYRGRLLTSKHQPPQARIVGVFHAPPSDVNSGEFELGLRLECGFQHGAAERPGVATLLPCAVALTPKPVGTHLPRAPSRPAIVAERRAGGRSSYLRAPVDVATCRQRSPPRIASPRCSYCNNDTSRPRSPPSPSCMGSRGKTDRTAPCRDTRP